MGYKVLNFIKHMVLFWLANILGTALLGVLLSIKDGKKIPLTIEEIPQALETLLIFAFFGALFNIGPYIIALKIIKARKNPALSLYTKAGASCPIFFVLIAMLYSLFEPSVCFLAVCLLLTGAICGTLYGYFDKKIHFNQGE